jgi:hypothetical protein
MAALVAPGRAAAQCPVNVPHEVGTWRTLPYLMPLNPISATLLHTGQILVVAGSENDATNNSTGAQSYRYVVWDPAGADGNSVSVRNVTYDVFCSGTAQLRDGRPLIVGGSSDYSFKGDKRASVFDPLTQTWMQSQSMADGRWYGTATALGDGRIMAFSGTGSSGGINNTVQIYDLANAGAGWGTAIAQPFSPPLFPRTFLLPSGKVFFTAQGAGSAASNAWIFDPVAKTWTSSVAKTVDRTYGSAVLLPLLPPSYVPKVMNLGGGSPGRNTTEIIDLSASSPSWSAGPNMSASRIQMNAVLLPTGEVLATGGSANDEGPDSPGKSADLFSPAGTTVRAAGVSSFSRLYHSTSLLLPDATVVSMGGNPGSRGSYLGGIEIYTPAYLYDANDQLITTARPSITAVNPEIVGYGGAVSVDYTSTSPIASAVLVRPGSTTHAFDMEQRVVGLCGPSPQPACSGSGTLSLTMPPNGNVAPPGHYMLFLVDSAGVPSVARWVQVSSFAGASHPDGAITLPAADTTITAGGSVFFDTATSASKYSWVFPGGSPATSSVKTPGNVTFSSPGVYVASLTVIDGANDSDESPPSRVITVNPASADFNISVSPASRTIVPGQSAQFTVSVTGLSGFGGTVTLTVSSESGYPSGVTSGGFSPSTIIGSGTSTLTMNTTTAVVPYALSLTVKGTSGSLVHTAATTMLMQLLPPTALQATPTDSQVALSWQASTGATSYRVARSLYPGGPYKTLACPSVLSYTDLGLQNGTTYYYVVSGVYTGGPAAGGASAYSTEIAATPPCPAVGPYTGSLGASKKPNGTTTWSWTAGGAAAYDVVAGDLGTLWATAGDFTAALGAFAGASACMADGTTSLSMDDPYGAPAPGAGWFTVLRPVAASCSAHGSYDEGQPSQSGSRDAEIAASGRSCP